MVARELTDQQSIPVTNNTNMEVKARDDLKLIGAQVFFRHGARTPVFLLPGLEEVRLKVSRKKKRRSNFMNRSFILENILRVMLLLNGILN